MSAPNAKGIDTEAGVTGWELALVTTASSSDNAANQSKLVFLYHFSSPLTFKHNELSKLLAFYRDSMVSRLKFVIVSS